PGKDLQRQSPLATYRADLRRGLAVHVELPIQRRQRREVVLLDAVDVRHHPWQAITAVNRPGASLAQAAPAVAHGRLRDRAKKETPQRLEMEKERDQERNDVQPNPPGDRAGARDS